MLYEVITQDDAFLVGSTGNRGSAARGDGTDDKTNTLRDKRVERVEGFGRFALVINAIDDNLLTKDTASCIGFVNSKIDAVDYSYAVFSKSSYNFV